MPGIKSDDALACGSEGWQVGCRGYRIAVVGRYTLRACDCPEVYIATRFSGRRSWIVDEKMAIVLLYKQPDSGELLAVRPHWQLHQKS